MVYATHSPLGPLADGILIVIILERIEIGETSEMASWSLRLTVRGGNPIGRDSRGKCPTTLERANENFGEERASGEERRVVGCGRMGAGCGLAGCAGTASGGGVARRGDGEHGRCGEGGGRFFPVLQRGVAREDGNSGGPAEHQRVCDVGGQEQPASAGIDRRGGGGECTGGNKRAEDW